MSLDSCSTFTVSHDHHLPLALPPSPMPFSSFVLSNTWEVTENWRFFFNSDLVNHEFTDKKYIIQLRTKDGGDNSTNR